MRKESKKWKLVKDKELLEFSEEKRGGYLTIDAFNYVKCEDCGDNIIANKDWQAFLKSSVISKGFTSDGYNFRTTVEFYCQKCSND
jgi:hypothetical protein